MSKERRKDRELRRSVQESGKFTQIFAIGAVVVLAIMDQVVQSEIDVPQWIYVSLVAIAVGASKSVKKAIERFFNSEEGK